MKNRWLGNLSLHGFLLSSYGEIRYRQVFVQVKALLQFVAHIVSSYVRDVTVFGRAQFALNQLEINQCNSFRVESWFILHGLICFFSGIATLVSKAFPFLFVAAFITNLIVISKVGL